VNRSLRCHSKPLNSAARLRWPSVSRGAGLALPRIVPCRDRPHGSKIPADLVGELQNARSLETFGRTRQGDAFAVLAPAGVCWHPFSPRLLRRMAGEVPAPDFLAIVSCGFRDRQQPARIGRALAAIPRGTGPSGSRPCTSVDNRGRATKTRGPTFHASPAGPLPTPPQAAPPGRADHLPPWYLFLAITRAAYWADRARR
jgi:hypothetical protein